MNVSESSPRTFSLESPMEFTTWRYSVSRLLGWNDVHGGSKRICYVRSDNDGMKKMIFQESILTAGS